MRAILFLVRVLTLGPYYGFIVQRSVRHVAKKMAGVLPRGVQTHWYGACYIDPKHLAIWFLVPTNADLARARAAGLEENVRDEMKAALARNGYPAASLADVGVRLESGENIEKAGGWFKYLR